MKNYFKSGLFCLVLALMVSCAPTSKEGYMEKFSSFMDDVSQEYKDYSPEDWDRADETYDKLTGEWFGKYKKEMTVKEKMMVRGYKTKYVYYRTLSGGKETWGKIKDSFDGEDVEDDINDAVQEVGEEVKEAIEEIGNSIENLVKELE